MFPHLHTGNANAHSPDDAQVLLNKGLQLTDTATLVGEKAVVDLGGSHIQPFGPGYPKSQSSPLLSTHLPLLYRCWRHGPAYHIRVPQSYSSYQEPHGCPPYQSGSTHCLASLENCCCHNSGTARDMWLSPAACQHMAPCWETGE